MLGACPFSCNVCSAEEHGAHHGARVVGALVLAPDEALLAVAVRALFRAVLLRAADVARERAGAQHEAGVAVAVAVGRPLRAVVVLVDADRVADAARDRAERVDAGVALALPGARPRAALLVLVVALGLAQPAARRALLHHEVFVLLALAAARPVRAALVHVAAVVLARATRVRALVLDHLLIRALTLAHLRPLAARDVIVVAVSPAMRRAEVAQRQEREEA